ncbi:MAG: hypothetical protein JWM05_3076 [Acidimicrobiales bacterium]|nr:hypothetical protein [Acidimicrobiales bacterium]
MTTRPIHLPAARSRATSTRWVAGAAATTVAAVALTGCWTSDQDSVLTTMNTARAANRVGALSGNDQLMAKALKWTQHMAATGVLGHSGGGTKIDTTGITGACGFGENVGVGPSLANIHVTMMGSAVHRGNILNPAFKRVGTGLVRSGTKVWVTELFVKPC